MIARGGLQEVTIDFETYYDAEYSLSVMTTAQYIFDPRFEALMVGIKIGDLPARIHDRETMRVALAAAFETPSVLIAHNAMFDASILAWKFGIRPERFFCTFMAANAVVGAFTRTNLASVARFLQIGEKGTELLKTKGKRMPDFSAQEWMDFSNYCAQDVELTHRAYRILNRWYTEHQINVA